MRRKRQNGLTLLEILVVTTLVALLAAVAAPSVGAGLETVRLRSSAERLAATLKLARDRAVRTRHYLEVRVDAPPPHRAQTRGALGTPAPSRRVAIHDLEGDYERVWELPEGIAVDCRGTACRAPAFVFPPDGSTPAVHLVLENSRGRAVRVEMDPFTAFPSVREGVTEATQ